MDESKIKDILIEEMENLGIIIGASAEDIDLLNKGIDSITFISFIVSIEERLNIEIPDEYLRIEALNSFNGFSHLVYSLVNEIEQ